MLSGQDEAGRTSWGGAWGQVDVGPPRGCQRDEEGGREQPGEPQGVEVVAQQPLHVESRGRRAAGSCDNTPDEEEGLRGLATGETERDPMDSHFSKPLSRPIGNTQDYINMQMNCKQYANIPQGGRSRFGGAGDKQQASASPNVTPLGT